MRHGIGVALALLCLLAGSRAACRAQTAAQPVARVTLPSGVRVVVQRDPESQLVAMDAFIGTAGAPEDAFRHGLANIVAHTLLRATVNQPQAVLSESVGNLGGNVGVSWDRNFTQVRALALASRFSDAAYLLSDVLKNSTFSPDAVRQSEGQLQQALVSGSDDVYAQTYDQLKAALYARTPVDPDSIGSADVIAAVKPADVTAFYDKYYTADNIVISVVGNVDPKQVVATLTGDFADFRRLTARRNGTAPPPVVPLAGPVKVKAHRGELTAGYVMVGYVVPGAGEPDYPAMLLLNALIGGMKTSLLFINLREKQGLGYETASNYSEDIGVADLTGYILSASVKQKAVEGGDSAFQPVLDALLGQFRAVREQPPTAAALARAKRYVIGSYLTRHERLLDRAYWLGFSEAALQETGAGGSDSFDADFAAAVNAVAASDVQRVAKKYFTDGYVVSMTLPGSPTAGDVSR